MNVQSEDGTMHTIPEWITKPEDAEVYDDLFWVKKQRWGTYMSVGADDNGIVTSLTEELCIKSTRWYLKALQEGWENYDTSTHEGEVGGKL